MPRNPFLSCSLPVEAQEQQPRDQEKDGDEPICEDAVRELWQCRPFSSASLVVRDVIRFSHPLISGLDFLENVPPILNVAM
jgi:hypothetical protein